MNIDKFVFELKKLNIEITDYQLCQFEKYYELLSEWNKVVNLTRIIEKDDVYLKHFYDSATIVKVIDLNKIDNLCDFGTGAGFPGIVLKILYPNLDITLVDSLNKRVNFLNIVIKELKLKNINAIHTRIEEYGKLNREKFDCVVARAVSSLNILIEYATPIIKKNQYFIAMKGNIDEELINSKKALLNLNMELIKKEEFKLPIENSMRNILLFIKKDVTPLKYPRETSIIKKSPL